jgi:hypothetical protein
MFADVTNDFAFAFVAPVALLYSFADYVYKYVGGRREEKKRRVRREEGGGRKRRDGRREEGGIP